ncbi:MAG: proton-conducting transporter membrane subunit [Candidatus Polarisedimenticolia bacterium]
MIPALLVALPALLGVAALGSRSLRAGVGFLLSGAGLHLAATVWLWGRPVSAAPGAVVGLDGTGLLFLSVVSLLFFVTALYSVPYLLHGTHHPQSAPHRFAPCLLWFLAAMTLVTVAQHFALIWVAVEATTLASAPLVYFYRRREALEAAWKYLLICSVGIALALLGVFFLGVAASAAGGTVPSLTLSELTRLAPGMSRPWLKAAFVFALVGYGTKMGLAPLHTWLPDTHSQSPSPVSALLSGALLNCALLAILRFLQVAVASGDAGFARALLLALGIVSMTIATAFMVGQRDYKRLFAYSSVENMGVIAAGLGFGGGAIAGALLHVANHSLCKAGLFFTAGNLLRAFGTTEAEKVRGVFRRLPRTGGLLAALVVALGGLPPFGPFMSEYTIFQSALSGPRSGLAIAFIGLLAVAFLGMAGAVFPMLQGAGDPGDNIRGDAALSLIAPAMMTAGALVLGLWLPPFLKEAIAGAARALGA